MAPYDLLTEENRDEDYRRRRAADLKDSEAKVELLLEAIRRHRTAVLNAEDPALGANGADEELWSWVA